MRVAPDYDGIARAEGCPACEFGGARHDVHADHRCPASCPEVCAELQRWTGRRPRPCLDHDPDAIPAGAAV